MERRQQARVLRHHAADAGARHRAAPQHRLRRRRGRLAHAGRAHPVAADDPRRRRSQLHVPQAFDVADGEVRHARRFDDARRWRSRPTAAGRSAATRAATSPTTSGRAPTSIASTRDRRAHADVQGPAHRAVTSFGISPDGKHFLYWKDNKFQAYDLDAGTSKTLGNGDAPSFVDTEFDHPGPKPSFGVAGLHERTARA